MLSIFDSRQLAGASPTASGRPNAGEILTPRTPLLLRGHTMERLAMADGERRGSCLAHRSTALSVSVDVAKPAAATAGFASRHRSSSLGMPAFGMSHVLSAGDDELDGLLSPRSGVQSARLASSPSRGGRFGKSSDRESAAAALSASVAPTQRASLVVQAAVALWRRRLEARGLRKWKDVLAEPLDLGAQLPALPPGVTAADEARRLLRNAETKREVARTRRLGGGATSSDSGGPGSQGEAATASVAARFSRAESNLLLLWAREAHAKSFRDVDDLTLREVVRHLRLRPYQDGEPLFFEGDAGDRFFLLVDGTVAVYSGASASIKHRAAASTAPTTSSATLDKPGPVVEDLAALGRRVFTYRAGESFGETAMFAKDAARTASAVAAGACEVLELAKDVYLRTLQRFHRQQYERSRRLHFAQRVPLFREWPRARVAAVAEALELRTLSFGDRLLVEGSAGPDACFLVLSGALKLTTLVALDEPASGDSDGGAGHGDAISATSDASPRRRRRHGASIDAAAASTKAGKHPGLRTALARRGGPAVAIALHSARPGEFVALEAVLRPNSRSPYSAVADAAAVEVYALAESDARALLGGAGSVVYQQLRLMADAAAKARSRRLEAAKRALQDRRRRDQPSPLGLDDGGFFDAELLGGMELDASEAQEAAAEAERESERRRRALAAEHTTYAPHLDAGRLLDAAADATRSLGDVPPCWTLGPASNRTDPDVRAVAAPRMLSMCVKNFVFANADTLASDYAARLQLHLPLSPPREPRAFLLSASPRVNATTVTSRPSDSPRHDGSPRHHRRHRVKQQQQPSPVQQSSSLQRHQLLGQHMRRLYETKMHWDAGRKSFVLVPPPVGDASAAADAPTPPKTRGSTEAASEPLYRQQRAAQETARRLLDERARKQSDKRASVSSKQATTSSFVHFF